MKKRALRTMLIAVVCCLVAAGCKREAELYYDASEYAVEIGALGYDAGTHDVENCVIFDAAKLAPYVGWYIAEIRLFNSDQNNPISYTPIVYEAAAGATTPGAPVALNAGSSEITSLNWRTISLDSPVTIQPSMDYWAGYRVVVEAGQYPLATGAEPDYGNNRLLGTEGFGPVTYNWIVRIVVKKRL